MLWCVSVWEIRFDSDFILFFNHTRPCNEYSRGRPWQELELWLFHRNVSESFGASEWRQPPLNFTFSCYRDCLKPWSQWCGGKDHYFLGSVLWDQFKLHTSCRVREQDHAQYSFRDFGTYFKGECRHVSTFKDFGSSPYRESGTGS